MARTAIEPSTAVARLLRQRRRELGLSLRQVAERTAAYGKPIPFTSLANIERGAVEPGLKRLHLLLRLYDLPPQLAHDLLDLEQFSGSVPDQATDEELYEAGLEHWKAGDIKQGLSHLFAVRAKGTRSEESRSERHRALANFAIAAGSLGKWRLSRQIIDDLLVEPLEKATLVRVLIQAAACWRNLGSSEAALGFLHRAESNVAPADHQRRAWVLHGRASALASLGIFDEAHRSLDAACEAYRLAKDPYGESRALSVATALRVEQGDKLSAVKAARRAFEHADRHGFGRLRIRRQIDLGRALVEVGQREEGLFALEEALACSIASQDRATRFYAHYYLWKALASIDPERGRLELSSAEHYVRHVDEETPETREIRSRAPLIDPGTGSLEM